MAKEKKALYHEPNAVDAFDPARFSSPSDKEIAGREIKMAKLALKKYAEDPSENGRKQFRHAVITLNEHGIKIPVRRTFELKEEATAEIAKSSIEVLEVDPLDPKGYEKLAEQFYQQYIAPGDITGAWAVLEKSMAEHTIELGKFEQAMASVLSEKHPEIDTGKFFGLVAWAKFNLTQAKAVLEAVKDKDNLMATLRTAILCALTGDTSAAFDAAAPLREHADPDIVLASLALCQ